LTIVGVAQPGFDGTTLGSRPDVFVPLTMRGALSSGWHRYDDRRQYWLYLFARLAPGVTMEQAAARENVLYHSIIDNIEAPLQQGVSPRTLAQFKAKKLALADGRRGLSGLHGQTKTPLTLLFAITVVVLAIACANIANLLLARAANRSLEMAVRLSLGATRGQLLVQLLTESMLLAVMGGAAGLFVAYVTLEALVAILPGSVASTLDFSVSGSAIAFAAILSMVTG